MKNKLMKLNENKKMVAIVVGVGVAIIFAVAEFLLQRKPTYVGEEDYYEDEEEEIKDLD